MPQIPRRLAKYLGQGYKEKDCAPGHQHKEILEVRRPESMPFAVHGVHQHFMVLFGCSLVLSVRSEKDWSSY